MDILINVGIVFAYLIGLIVIVILAFILCAIRNARKLMLGLPWLKWLTLDEIVEMGFSSFWSQILLPAFHEKGYLEIRPSGEWSEKERELVEHLGFNLITVEFYDFKFTKRAGMKKQKLWSLIIPAWQPEPI